MLLPLAEERRNVITMANMFGYKVKPVVPSFVDLTFTSEVNISSGDASKLDYSDAGTFDAGIEIVSDSNSDIIFSTLEPIDFTITGSNDTETIGSTAASGLARTYTLTRTVKAVSATEKTISFKINAPEKFKKLTIPDTNVVDIISCIDTNGNNWYEVDFLAQDKIPIQTHYTDDINRDSAYSTETGGIQSSTSVPYSLTYITTGKRFTRETNQDNTTSLVFGNGVLKNGQIIDDGYIDLEQVGITIPGQSNDLNQSVDPLLGDEYSTLGEAPNQVTLTITYRVGGGVTSNVPSGDISTTPTITAQNGNTGATLTSVTNNAPARGGKDSEDVDEIREKAKAFFATQNRAVTKEDYEARVLNLPSKYGNISKVYVAANIDRKPNEQFFNQINSIMTNGNSVASDLNLVETVLSTTDGTISQSEKLEAIQSVISPLVDNTNSVLSLSNDLKDYIDTSMFHLSPVEITLLGYNTNKQLIGNPHSVSLGTNDNLPMTLKTNIKKYLENYNLLTDTVVILDGYIVNFGVFFDVIAEKYADKQKVKLACIQKVKEYFNINKMQFNQPIYKSQLEFELMGIEGVRSIGHITLTQHEDYNGDGNLLTSPTYTYSYSVSGNGADLDGDGVIDGGFVNQSDGEGTVGYGYKYNFKNALSDDGTIILPPHIATPTVFELKNPNQNIQGRVR
tara:strand:- start:552 stop:2591 length:2040 start_codon:yes stop_codon:yes gene_type:complete